MYDQPMPENGALDICVVAKPGGDDAPGDRFTGMQITPAEWDHLFLHVLGVPEMAYEDGMTDHYEQQEQGFRKFISGKGYEMLSRIWDIYQDALFPPADVEKLKAECTRLEAATNDELALSALRKLVKACDLALNANSGLALLSD